MSPREFVPSLREPIKIIERKWNVNSGKVCSFWNLEERRGIAKVSDWGRYFRPPTEPELLAEFTSLIRGL